MGYKVCSLTRMYEICRYFVLEFFSNTYSNLVTSLRIKNSLCVNMFFCPSEYVPYSHERFQREFNNKFFIKGDLKPIEYSSRKIKVLVMGDTHI